jgi:hypothetical protein
MTIKKRIVEEKKIADNRQSCVKKERRETPRCEPQKKQIKAKFAYSGHKYAPGILELSLSGCRITTDAQLKVGDVIKFQSPAATRGRVVWRRMGFYGIEFID